MRFTAEFARSHGSAGKRSERPQSVPDSLYDPGEVGRGSRTGRNAGPPKSPRGATREWAHLNFISVEVPHRVRSPAKHIATRGSEHLGTSRSKGADPLGARPG